MPQMCIDGRIWGQNNKEAGSHLGVLTERGIEGHYIKKGTASESKQGDKNPFYGKTHSPATRLKLSEAHRGKTKTLETRHKISVALKGEKHPFWKGGISLVNERIRRGLETRLWRGAVFARDNWTCQHCSGKNGNSEGIHLEAHHIKSFALYPILRFDIDNGKTLCSACHKLYRGVKIQCHNQ